MTVVAVVAAGILVTGCDQLSSGTNASEPAEPGSAVVADTPEAPTLGAEIMLTMDCAALSSSEGFSREILLTGADGAYTYQLGEKASGRYEFWNLEVTAPDTFTISGEYVEGSPDLKTLEFSGTVADGSLSGEGRRGPRVCTVQS